MESLNPAHTLEILCLLLTVIVAAQVLFPSAGGKTLWQRPQLARMARFDRREDGKDRRSQHVRMLVESRRNQRRSLLDDY